VLLDTSAWAAAGDGGANTDIEGATALLRGAGWGITVAQPTIPMTATWATLCRTHGSRADAIISG
jgi:hypothetical protein